MSLPTQIATLPKTQIESCQIYQASKRVTFPRPIVRFHFEADKSNHLVIHLPQLKSGHKCETFPQLGHHILES
jgi:hypothetical protein